MTPNPQNELRELERLRVEFLASVDQTDLMFNEIKHDASAGRSYRQIALALDEELEGSNAAVLGLDTELKNYAYFHPIEPCKWTHDESTDSYDTGCDNKHCFIDGGVMENEHRYCPYCGHPIETISTDGSAHEPPEGLK